MGAHYGPWIEAMVPIALGFVVRRGPSGEVFGELGKSSFIPAKVPTLPHRILTQAVCSQRRLCPPFLRLCLWAAFPSRLAFNVLHGAGRPLLMPVCHIEPPINWASVYPSPTALLLVWTQIGSLLVPSGLNHAQSHLYLRLTGHRVLVGAHMSYESLCGIGCRVTWCPTEECLISNRTLIVNLTASKIPGPPLIFTSSSKYALVPYTQCELGPLRESSLAQGPT